MTTKRTSCAFSSACSETAASRGGLPSPCELREHLQLTSCILHEAAHVAGAPGDTVAEGALEGVQRAAGLPR